MTTRSLMPNLQALWWCDWWWRDLGGDIGRAPMQAPARCRQRQWGPQASVQGAAIRWSRRAEIRREIPARSDVDGHPSCGTTSERAEAAGSTRTTQTAREDSRLLESGRRPWYR